MGSFVPSSCLVSRCMRDSLDIPPVHFLLILASRRSLNVTYKQTVGLIDNLPSCDHELHIRRDQNVCVHERAFPST